MKPLLALIAMLAIHTSNAQAMTACSVSKESPTEKMNFVETVFSIVSDKDSAWVLSEDLSTATPIDFESISYEEWQKINGRIVVFFNAEENNQYGIAIAKVNLADKDNFLPVLGMTYGQVTQYSPLALVLPKKKLSAVCKTI